MTAQLRWHARATDGSARRLAVLFLVTLLSFQSGPANAEPNAEPGLEDTYASEGFLRELLCEGEEEGRSCGPDAEGAPMVCARANRCGWVERCVVCLDGVRVSKTDGAVDPSMPVHSPSMRLPETDAQRDRRIVAEDRLRLRTRIFPGALLVAAMAAAFVVFRLARKRRSPAWLWGAAAIAIAGAGAAWWSQNRARNDLVVALATNENERVVRLQPVTTPVALPRDHWMHPEHKKYVAQLAHMKGLLDAKHKDWRARAVDAGESPPLY